MKWITICGLGIVLAMASARAPAQDFTAGKTPAQLFSSDCAECHRSPNGLAKGRDVKALAGFLREHYTTKSDTAGSLAAYVSGFAGRGPADVRNRAGADAPPVPSERADRRKNEAAAVGEDGRAAKPAEEPARRRRTVNLSGDGEKRRPHNDAEAARPAAGAAPPVAAARTRGQNEEAGREAARPADGADAAKLVRSYVYSGLGFEGTVAEAAKAGPSKGRKRHNGKETPAPEPPLAAKTGSDAPAPAASPSTMPLATPPVTPPAMPLATPPPAAPPGATAAAAPAEGSAGPSPAPGAIVTPPRLGQ